MGERRGGGRECGGKEEDMEQREMGMHEKQPKNATYLAFGDVHWGLPPHVIHFEKAVFGDNISIIDGMPDASILIVQKLESFKDDYTEKYCYKNTFQKALSTGNICLTDSMPLSSTVKKL